MVDPLTTGVFDVRPEYTEGLLDRGWHQILSASGLVCVSFMGLTNVASVAEEVTTLESFYEPFLLQAGFLARTSRGRIATAKAYNHLGLTSPKPSTQQSTLL